METQMDLATLEERLKVGGWFEVSRDVWHNFYPKVPDDVIDLLRQYPPEKICTDCGAPLVATFTPQRAQMWEIMECQQCRLAVLVAARDRDMDVTLRDRGMPKRHRHARLGDFPATIIDAIPDDRGVYIHGPVGSGKTHLLCAVMRSEAVGKAIYTDPKGEYQLREFHRYPLLTSIQEVLHEVRGTYNTRGGDTEEGILEEVSDVPLLLLDDVGVEKPTEWALGMIYLIVDRRYRDNRRTFFTSNLSLAELAEHLNDRIASRITEMCTVIRLDGRDRRLKGGV
ncbi:hypothetical protein [Desulfatitalea alkaliphila]|uniref:AAA+ ATPase domain-containing protein n=1 Tax=Desulfatitalea alkaliphila TaxID=2929485 RepID=A0AA41UQ37_9BACT|nr:hypothetical protein [Desulfatitalea alkaliphila]MCJ8501028.1 hypothetical protein [Desulfatitalea alkaliphila]